MILVLVEHDGSRPERSSLEAVTFGRGLAERLGESLQAVLIGPGTSDMAAGLGAYGVSRALVIEDERLANYAPAAWGRNLGAAVDASGADLILAVGSDRGHEVLAYAAAMAGLPMAANCVEIEPGEPFRLTRQRWGGSLLEDATLDGPVRFVTVAEHIVEPAAAAASTKVAVERVDAQVTDADLRSRVVSRLAPETGTVSLADA
ncbi:MAG: electron transfer flavoprotein subunit alpha/FixB family protein, partial [Chloroflexota bacterium]|nr:electron transfer flavoprotein subunit alpha/FixB family protein [Chloroflexota bacterium]